MPGVREFAGRRLFCGQARRRGVGGSRVAPGFGGDVATVQGVVEKMNRHQAFGLFFQLRSASTGQHPTEQRPRKPQPQIMREGCAAIDVLAFLRSDPVFRMESEILQATGRSHSAVSWALLGREPPPSEGMVSGRRNRDWPGDQGGDRNQGPQRHRLLVALAGRSVGMGDGVCDESGRMVRKRRCGRKPGNIASSPTR